MNDLQSAYYGGLLIGIVVTLVMRAMIKVALEIKADYGQQKNA